MELIYGKQINFKLVNDKKILAEMKMFLIRACWKMIDTLPFNDGVLNLIDCLNPKFFDISKWQKLGKKFERILINKMSILQEELEIFETNLIELNKLFEECTQCQDKQPIIQFYLNATQAAKYPTMYHLAGNILALPHTTAEIERLFSQLKLIKNSKRSSLSQENLEAILMLKISNYSIHQPDFYKQIETKWKEIREEENSKKRKFDEINNGISAETTTMESKNRNEAMNNKNKDIPSNIKT
jgi:hypothetical protein